MSTIEIALSNSKATPGTRVVCDAALNALHHTRKP
jgi:hypothetical protein